MKNHNTHKPLVSGSIPIAATIIIRLVLPLTKTKSTLKLNFTTSQVMYDIISIMSIDHY